MFFYFPEKKLHFVRIYACNAPTKAENEKIGLNGCLPSIRTWYMTLCEILKIFFLLKIFANFCVLVIMLHSLVSPSKRVKRVRSKSSSPNQVVEPKLSEAAADVLLNTDIISEIVGCLSIYEYGAVLSRVSKHFADMPTEDRARRPFIDMISRDIGQTFLDHNYNKISQLSAKQV